MSRSVDTIRAIYRAVLPASIRNTKALIKFRQQLPHDWVYNSSYYSTTVEEPAVRSAPRIAGEIMRSFSPHTVVDVGCGTGALLEGLRDCGCDVFGLEYSEVGLEYCRQRRNLNVARFDIERHFLSDHGVFDVAVSMEVAEHLPERAADKFVSILTGLSSQIVFTAARPGQGGADHVNEQPASYWIKKFEQRGFRYAQDLARQWAYNWKASGDVAPWYYENLMIFEHTSPVLH